ncbi:hypothetical protein JS565_14925 [Salmonella enterica subsp. enterica serovar Senftenberg]|nr:hypothetical protein [Salmonella enterica subsp. enterica serovar Senftenberg]
MEVEGKAFVVKVSDGGDISQLTAAVPVASSAPATAPAGAGTRPPPRWRATSGR